MITNHQKTVTSLSLASGGRRVVSGGLDGHVKVFETQTGGWNVVAGAKYPSPILSVRVITSGANAEDRHLAVGMQSGVLSLRTRLTGPEATREREREKEMQALLEGTIATHDKAKRKRKGRSMVANRLDLIGEGADVVIAGNPAKRDKSAKEKPWQKDLRRGQFASALDRVIDTSSNTYTPLTVLTLLVALRHRSALREALEARDEDSVKPVLSWVQKHIVDPRYLSVCVDVALHLLDLYAEFVGGSKELEDGFRLLHRRVRQEVERAQMATQTGGMLGGLLVGMA
jgi:U3 small nucleolar RNA-associated protein 15